MDLAYLAALATAACFAVSALFEDRAAKQSPAAERGGPSLWRVTTQVPYVAGMALSLVGWALSLLALQRLPLFAVQAIGASSIGFIVLLQWLRTRERVTSREAVLLVVLGAGLVALAVAAEPGSPESVGRWFDIGMWIGVGALAVLWLVVQRRVDGSEAGALLGMVSGLAYGGTALCARALETDSTWRGILFDPMTLALVPFAAIGIGSFAAALQRGSVAVAAACQHATMTIIPSVVGLLVLGDRARNGFAPVAVVGFVLTIAAVLALTLLKPSPASEPELARTS